MRGETSSFAAKLAAPGMNRRRFVALSAGTLAGACAGSLAGCAHGPRGGTKPGFLDRAFSRSLGVRRLEGSELFRPGERPDVIAEEPRRLWAAQGDQA